MKIGDVVSYASGLDRHPDFGKLIRIEKAFIGPRRIETMTAVILLVDDTVIKRDLKRVKSVAQGRQQAARNAKRDAKRYRRKPCL